MKDLIAVKKDMVSYAEAFIGSRYAWGGEGPYNVGFDCSGLILEVLRAFGMWGRDDATSQMILDRFLSKGLVSSVPDKCCLVFFGKDLKSITHIGMMINEWQFIEAGGGDSKTVDKGMVRIRPLTARKDLAACVDIFPAGEDK